MTPIALLAVLLLAPIPFLGLINRTKAWWAGRRGVSIIQPWHDIARLLRKGQVVSPATGWIFRLAPAVNLSCVAGAALLVPLAGGRGVISFPGDFILFAYLLGLGRLFAILSALETGSSFEGMGASREALFSILVEPAFFFLMAMLAAVTGKLSLAGLLAAGAAPSGLAVVIALLSLTSLLVMALTEGCRVPVDDPNTHLELTMIHEVMILDNAGPPLALWTYGTGLKLAVLSSLAVAVVIPSAWPPLVSAAAWLLALAGVAVLIGLVESTVARLRMSHVPQFIFIMSSNALMILAAVLMVRAGIVK